MRASKTATEYFLVYYTLPGKNALIDGTYLPELRGLPTEHRVRLDVKNNKQAFVAYAGAVSRLTAQKDLRNETRILIGKPKLVKITATEFE